jgi:hypothetical protein
VDEQVAAEQLSFEHESKAVPPGAEVVMICVGTRPDISLAGLELGSEPKVALDGLDRMIAWASEAWTT